MSPGRPSDPARSRSCLLAGAAPASPRRSVFRVGYRRSACRGSARSASFAFGSLASALFSGSMSGGRSSGCRRCRAPVQSRPGRSRAVGLPSSASWINVLGRPPRSRRRPRPRRRGRRRLAAPCSASSRGPASGPPRRRLLAGSGVWGGASGTLVGAGGVTDVAVARVSHPRPVARPDQTSPKRLGQPCGPGRSASSTAAPPLLPASAFAWSARLARLCLRRRRSQRSRTGWARARSECSCPTSRTVGRAPAR